MKLFKITLLFLSFLLLSGCDTGDRGCFGLCSKKDDDENSTTANPLPNVDRSCYAGSSLGDRQELSYAVVASNNRQRLRFEPIASAAMDNLRPVLVWVPGRTWTQNNDFDDVPDLARSLARELGAHLASVQYRDAATAIWPEPIRDIHTAIRFLKTRANDLYIDVDRFILAGDRGGAHLSALAATSVGIQEFLGDDHISESSRVSSAIVLSGVFDFATITADSEAILQQCNGTIPAISTSPIRELLDCPLPLLGAPPLSECDANELRQASPTFHVSSDDPPILIWHGTADCSYPPNQSERLSDVLSDRSVGRVLNLIPGADARLDGLSAVAIELELAGVLECD